MQVVAARTAPYESMFARSMRQEAPGDADGLGSRDLFILLSLLLLFLPQDIKTAMFAQRLIVLTDLISLRQIWVKVLLTVELGKVCYLAVEGQAFE